MAKSMLGVLEEGKESAPAATAVQAGGETFWLVLEDAEIPENRTRIRLRKGKVLSSRGYDIEKIKGFGVKLQEQPQR